MVSRSFQLFKDWKGIPNKYSCNGRRAYLSKFAVVFKLGGCEQ